MEPKDIISLIVGLLIFALGILPILSWFSIGPEWFDIWQFLPAAIISWVVAAAALYLVIDSVIEITNSASIGVISLVIALICLTAGVLPVLASFNIGPSFFALSFFGGAAQMIFNIVLVIEGLFLMIAMVAMEM
ncbi:hypothetical protein HQ545_00570 [Candidatus Woesearchaeota archaeon]|nr:hypothetical protein [Candidatus Woesearchaeota archaeon]